MENVLSGVRPAAKPSLNWLICRNTIWFTLEKNRTNARYVFYCSVKNEKKNCFINISSVMNLYFLQVCQKRFSSTSNLKTHQRLHSGERPYQCKHCPARFTQFVHLKLHKRLHTGERPHRCPHCPCAYLHYCSLQVHLQGFCPLSPMISHRHSPEELHRVNSEIQRFDISEAADQLEAMAAEAELDKGNIIALIKQIETNTSGHRGDGGLKTELNTCKSAKDLSVTLTQHGSHLPLHQTRIKLETSCISKA